MGFMDLIDPEGERQRKLEEARKARDRAAFAAAAGDPVSPHPGLGFAMDMTQQGFANHAKAADAINSAISNEMDSRVAQEREARRMQHEKDLAQMKLESERQQTERLIARLQQENDRLPPGVISRIRIDGQGRMY